MKYKIIEWDVQLFIASKLSWENGEILAKMIDPKWYEIYEEIYKSWGNSELTKKMEDYFFGLVWEDKFSKEATEEYFKMIVNNTKAWNDEKLFDHIIIRSLEKDELAWEKFLTQWDFRDNIISVIKQHMSN